MNTKAWGGGASLAAMILAMGLPHSAEAQGSAANLPAVVNVPAARCAQLKSFQWPDLAVDEVRVVAAGPIGRSTEAAPGPAPDTQVPEHCLFRATISGRTGPEGQRLGIGVDLRLPLQWNGRFAFEGGGGLDGIQRPSYGSVWGTINPPALSRRFAVVSTDGGHRSATMSDPQFGLDQQARIDYAYNAVDKTTLLAKVLIAQFYGQGPSRSYFLGCSNGGRQAMMVTQRMPLQFDGVVSGDPSFRLTRTNIAQAWNQVVVARAAPKDAQGRPILSRAISPADLQLVSQAVVQECDAKDGLADGIINDHKACHFDPAALTCKGEKSASCLTSVQVTALKDLMRGPHDSRGQPLHAAFPYDAGISDPSFHRMHFGTSQTGEMNSADATLGFGSLRYLSMTPPNPAFDPMKFDLDRDPQRLLETGKINDADSVFLASFAKRGKLILYHGMSDQGLSPLDTADWYDRLEGANGPNVQDWARLFLVPGMAHCAGGPATDQFDMLTAIQDWVEKGKAPDRIVARGKTFPGVTRPLCPHPTIARYAGGDPKSEASFSCAASAASSVAAERPAHPSIDGPIRNASTSHAFVAAAYQNVPFDLTARGYIEEEYLIRGVARVFDWGQVDSPVVLGKGPYATRILVRRPQNPQRFSGTVIVEPLNPSADVDLPIMWAQSHEQWIADGHTWVGVTIKPNTLRALKLFDSARYASVGFPNPRPEATCKTADINPLSGPTTPDDESGLAWDVLSQLGSMLKSSAALSLLGRPAARLYMTGQSQSAGYARTYATVFARTVSTENGKPLYDAYLYSGGPPWQVPLHQCRKDLEASDPRLITPAVGVPVIELFAEGDIGTNIMTRRPDSDVAPDLFRRYEIAGAAHVDPWEFRSFARNEDAKRAQGRVSEGPDSQCAPADVTTSDFPVRYVFDAAWRNLDAWVLKGTAPPRAEPLQLQSGVTPFDPARAFVLDAAGNARGGVRSTHVDVPRVRYVGAKSGGFRCMFYGYKMDLDAAELRRLYPNRSAYLEKLRARADELVEQRWLTPADRDELLRTR